MTASGLLNPQRYCYRDSFCTPKGGERLFQEVFPAITRLLGSTGVAPVKSVNSSIEIIYTLPATRCTVYSGEREQNFNIHGSDSSQKFIVGCFYEFFTVSASAKELIELLWNAIGGKFNTVQGDENSWFIKTVKFLRVPWLVRYFFFIIS